MIDLIVRKSQLFDKFYLDYKGVYTVEGLSKTLGVTRDFLKNTYESQSGSYHDVYDVYYFDVVDQAKQALELVLKKVQPAMVSVSVQLTYEEIEYIKRALINEDSNVIFTENKIREAIFSKLNS